MKVPRLIASLMPKKKKLTPLQKIMGALKPSKKRLPVLKKNIVKKWRKSSFRKTLKARGKKTLLAFKKGPGKKYIPALLLQRMP